MTYEHEIELGRRLLANWLRRCGGACRSFEPALDYLETRVRTGTWPYRWWLTDAYLCFPNDESYARFIRGMPGSWIIDRCIIASDGRGLKP